MWLKATGSALVPDDERGARWLARRAGRRIDVSEIGHSLPEHRLLFSYLNWAWESAYRDEFPDAEDFRAFVSVSVGHCVSTYFQIEGETVRCVRPKSWSFRKCDHDLFNDLTARVDRLLSPRVGSLDDFRRNEHLTK